MEVVSALKLDFSGVKFVDLDPIIEPEKERLRLTEDLKEVQIVPKEFHTIKINTSITKVKENDLVALIKNNIGLLSSSPSNMSEINTRVVCHWLTFNPIIKLIMYRKYKVGKEKRATTIEVRKLKEVDFISEIKYPSWLENEW